MNIAMLFVRWIKVRMTTFALVMIVGGGLTACTTAKIPQASSLAMYGQAELMTCLQITSDACVPSIIQTKKMLIGLGVDINVLNSHLVELSIPYSLLFVDRSANKARYQRRLMMAIQQLVSPYSDPFSVSVVSSVSESNSLADKALATARVNAVVSGLTEAGLHARLIYGTINAPVYANEVAQRIQVYLDYSQRLAQGSFNHYQLLG